MGQSAIMAALAAKDYEAIRAAMVGEFVPVIPDYVDPLTWDPRELTGVGGNTFQAVMWNQSIWYRDETSVAAADEITCITLADGVNYLINIARVSEIAVISRTVTIPPDPDDVVVDDRPEIGDAYLIPVASSGDWATHEDYVALWTSRGWYYIPPSVGTLVYVRDELGYVHYSDDDAWESGFGSYSLTDGSIRPNHLLIRAWAVENQTTTAPPATGPSGEQYIIGPSATGTWSGHDGEIAWRPATDAEFVITTPFVGEKVYDKLLQINIKWSGTAWINNEGAWIAFTGPVLTESGTTGGAQLDLYTYSTDTAPTTSQGRFADNVTISHTANLTGAKLRLRYSAAIEYGDVIFFHTGTDTKLVIAVFRDSESNAIVWRPIAIANVCEPPSIDVEFHFTAIDAAAHDYKICIMMAYGDGSTVRYADPSTRRSLTIEEAVPD